MKEYPILAQEELDEILASHVLWLAGKGGKRAYLANTNLTKVDLTDANLNGAYLTGANMTRARLVGAHLADAHLNQVDMTGALLTGANMARSDLTGAILHDADLRAYGDMVYLKTMQFDKWAIGYTHDTLQIGCQRHPIKEWQKWDTPMGQTWIAEMDEDALAWAERNLALVLQIIKQNPAKK